MRNPLPIAVPGRLLGGGEEVEWVHFEIVETSDGKPFKGWELKVSAPTYPILLHVLDALNTRLTCPPYNYTLEGLDDEGIQLAWQCHLPTDGTSNGPPNDTLLQLVLAYPVYRLKSPSNH